MVYEVINLVIGRRDEFFDLCFIFVFIGDIWVNDFFFYIRGCGYGLFDNVIKLFNWFLNFFF